MSTIHPRIYLASQSPRRRELLKQIGVNFDMLLLRNDPRRKIDVDEAPEECEAPVDYVQRICRAKAAFAWDVLTLRNLPPHPVLAADTTVTLDNKIIGKPHDREDAIAMLHQLSGRQHQVLSAVAIAFGDHIEARLSATAVTFATLSKERIHRYVLTNESHDKAGAYGIQGRAGRYIPRIEGCYFNVVGLPISRLLTTLHELGFSDEELS